MRYKPDFESFVLNHTCKKIHRNIQGISATWQKLQLTSTNGRNERMRHVTVHLIGRENQIYPLIGNNACHVFPGRKSVFICLLIQELFQYSDVCFYVHLSLNFQFSIEVAFFNYLVRSFIGQEKPRRIKIANIWFFGFYVKLPRPLKQE